MRSSELNELVKQGLILQKEGDLEAAGRLYCEVIETDGQRADALHLFGVVLYQLGDPISAIKAICRAIAIRPNLAHFHVNLGEIYRSFGRPDRAAGCFILALKLRPDRLSDLTEFDLVIRRDGQFDNLKLPDRQPPSLAPALTVEHTHSGIQCRNDGDLLGAYEHLSQAVLHGPDVGIPHSNLCQILLDLDRVEEALFHGNKAVLLAPDHPEPWIHLGNVLQMMGRTLEAKSSYLEALRIAPDNALAYNNLGRVLISSLMPHEALAWFRMAQELDPSSVMIRSNIASAIKETGQVEEAADFSAETVRLAPLSDEAHLIHGSILHELRRLDEAVVAFREAIRINPDFILAHESLGILLTEMGELEAAETSLREVLKRSGNHTRALVGLANIHRGKLPEADLIAIRQLIEQPTLADNHRADLYFAIAQVKDARGDYCKAAENLKYANATRHGYNARSGRAYRSEDHEAFVEEMMAVCSADFFERVEGFGLASSRPVFIVGLPRSGTSLTEQILASHSQVIGLGETEFARNNFETLPDRMGSKAKDLDCLGQIDRATTIQIAQDHLARIARFDDQARLVVDKMPDNYLYLGYLATIFPHAKFIHCRRDLRDIAVSCWSTNFWFLDWPNRFETIATRFAMYERLMSHWQDVLPVPILHVDYEETVNDLETAARTLLDWCGLDWEPACLAFHESKRAVRTASVTQVRQPIYRRSVERWRNYETELGPLFDRIADEVRV